MKTFRQFINETAGTFSIVSCKDKKRPNFQVWGAMSDLKCGDNSPKLLKMKFKDKKK